MKTKLLLAGVLALGTFQTASAVGGHPGGGHGGGHPGNGGHPAGAAQPAAAQPAITRPVAGGHHMSEGHFSGGQPGFHGGGQPGYHGGTHYAGGQPGYHGGGMWRTGHISNPHRLELGGAPAGGWRGHEHSWGGFNYHMWNWAYGPWMHSPYFNWHLGLNYYILEGLACQATNTYVGGSWTSSTYNFSDDSINSAMGFCESDPNVVMQGAQGYCQITHCDRSW